MKKYTITIETATKVGVMRNALEVVRKLTCENAEEREWVRTETNRITKAMNKTIAYAKGAVGKVTLPATKHELAKLLKDDYKLASIRDVNAILEDEVTLGGNPNAEDNKNNDKDLNGHEGLAMNILRGKAGIEYATFVKSALAISATSLLVQAGATKFIAAALTTLWTINPVVAVCAAALGGASLINGARKLFAPEIKKFLAQYDKHKEYQSAQPISAESAVDIEEFIRDNSTPPPTPGGPSAAGTGTAGPGTAGPGTPAPGTAATGTPAPGTAATGTPAPGTAATGTPAPGTTATGTPAPGTAATGASEEEETHEEVVEEETPAEKPRKGRGKKCEKKPFTMKEASDAVKAFAAKLDEVATVILSGVSEINFAGLHIKFAAQSKPAKAVVSEWDAIKNKVPENPDKQLSELIYLVDSYINRLKQVSKDNTITDKKKTAQNRAVTDFAKTHRGATGVVRDFDFNKELMEKLEEKGGE